MTTTAALPLYERPSVRDAWMATASAADLMRFARADDWALGAFVAEHGPLGALTDDDLWALAADSDRRTVLFRNPTVTDAQIHAFAARALARPTVPHLVQRLFGVLATVSFAGRDAVRTALAGQCRAWLAAHVPPPHGDEHRSTAAVIQLVCAAAWDSVTPAEAVQWYAVATTETTTTAWDVVDLLARHPSTPPAVLEAIFHAAGPHRMGTIHALADNPTLRRAPGAFAGVLAQGYVGASLALAPQLTATELADAVAGLAGPRRGAEQRVREFFASLPPAARARLTPESLLPLLTSPHAAIRLQGQLWLGTLTSGVPAPARPRRP